MTDPSPPESFVGRRVRVGGHLGTVRWGPGELKAPSKAAPADAGYNASTASAASVVQVVGVEYDEAGVGKHDGTYQGTRLFTCRDGYGSFAKIEKAEFGIPIQRALAEKYFAAAQPEAAQKSNRNESIELMEYTDSKGREKAMTVELIGRYDVEQRQSRLEAFIELSLSETQIGSRYRDDVWEGDWSLPRLKSLWLDKTLLCDWADVAAICELCPNLEWVSLSKTKLKSPPPRGVSMHVAKDAPTGMLATIVLQPFVCKIRTLVLNDTGVTWQDVLALDAHGLFPCLEHLHLSKNGLQEGIPSELGSQAMNGTQPSLARLRSVVLDSNGISDWSVLQRAISAFPALEALHLNDNCLGQNLEGLKDAAEDQTPRRLTSLFLNENKIASWQAVAALTNYALLELKVQRITLTEGASPLASPMLLRQILIALMPTLLRLNASEVTVKERTAAERYFASIAQQENSPIVKGMSEHCNIQEHIARLQTIHGDYVTIEATEHGQATRSALSNALVEVVLRPVGAAIVEKPPTRKKLPHTMTVGELKRLAHLLFKSIPLDRITLTLADDGLPFGIPLNDEARELGFFGIGDGAEIRVDDEDDLKKANEKR